MELSLTAPEMAMIFLQGFLRTVMGLFFIISGYHKLFNKQRHATITTTMVADHVPLAKFNSWFVPSVEFSGGFALIVGLLTPLAALGLFCVCCVATLVDGIKRVISWNPIDRADFVDDVLYLPEVMYSVILIVIMIIGAGPFSLDTLLHHYVSWW